MQIPAWVKIPAAARQLNQTTLSVGATSLAAILAIGAIQIFGDPHAAAPRQILALDGSDHSGAFRTPLSGVVMDAASASAAAYQDGAPTSGDVVITDPAGAEAAAASATADPSSPLPRAPVAALTARGPLGPLPVIGPDGNTPYNAYKRPFTGDADKPRVAVIVGGLGFNAQVTQAAIEQLPAAVTLSFVPYADRLQSWIDSARAHGHEVIIELPMESFDPTTDTGPQTLLAGAAPKDNIGKLENLMSRASGYFAVSNYQGAKFAQSVAASAPVVQALKSRGLAFISNGIGTRAALASESQKAGLPFTSADRVLDAQREADAISGQLDALEAMAQSDGNAIGAGFAYPITVERIKYWANDLESRGVVLAPASSVLEQRARHR
ncbi:MAG: divergent polysaccharide deacetylase family protein [Alphaproteobacteria bacterium]